MGFRVLVTFAEMFRGSKGDMLLWYQGFNFLFSVFSAIHSKLLSLAGTYRRGPKELRAKNFSPEIAQRTQRFFSDRNVGFRLLVAFAEMFRGSKGGMLL
jgi:hypothetical protein